LIDRSRLRYGAGSLGLLVPAAALTGCFLVWPLVRAGQLAGSPGSAAHQLWVPTYARDLWFTLTTAVFAAAVAMTVGFILAVRLHGSSGYGSTVIVALVLLPLLVPHLVAAYAIRLLLDQSGPLIRGLFHGGGPNLVVSPVALVFALVWKFLPFAYLNARAARDAVPPELLDAASDLGSSLARRARSILLPLMLPGLLAGGVLVFVMAAAQFSLTLVAYGGLHTTTIPMDVFFLSQGENEPALAAALGVAFAAFIVVVSVAGEGLVRWRTRAAG
jgi:ABC-type Fe3+ transport system permease subunit